MSLNVLSIDEHRTVETEADGEARSVARTVVDRRARQACAARVQHRHAKITLRQLPEAGVRAGGIQIQVELRHVSDGVVEATQHRHRRQGACVRRGLTTPHALANPFSELTS